jgi:hypothetical protein
MIRRKKIKKEEKENSQITDPKVEIIQDEPSINDSVGVGSIEEFIERKKLQNRLLEEMIKKINDPENLNKQ